jgi:hypothetical protein
MDFLRPGIHRQERPYRRVAGLDVMYIVCGGRDQKVTIDEHEHVVNNGFGGDFTFVITKVR